ncbi:MAG: UDP-N-acetylmuramoyl-L-alanine--D-glutamate ligase, partial [bacterium]|nr:UDP-N-acetylmuramoyl-L-alanine--D-glutamate ligase [bacterium]
MKATVIFGLGSEGLSTYNYLRALNSTQQFLLVDDKPAENLSPEWRAVISNDQQARFLHSAEVTETEVAECRVIKTPGIPPSHPVAQLAQRLQLEVTSNTQLFFEHLQQHAPETITIGVTGTKGKSTTTSLIHHVLKSAGLPALLAGNIGVPALDLVPQVTEVVKSGKQPIVVLELSSHQLMDLPYSPKIAVVLDITPEHLDYYASLSEYTAAKSAICRFQRPEDLILFDPTLSGARSLAAKSPARQLLFADTAKSDDPSALAAALEGDALLSQGKALLSATELPLTGRHQWLNALPSVVIGVHLGVPSEQIATALRSFCPLPHRLELVATRDTISYYNDSQATTPEAAIAALRSFPKDSVVLIAGGSEKGVDLTEFAKEILVQGVKAVALFPPTGEKI